MNRAFALLVLVVVAATAGTAGAKPYRSWTSCTSTLPARAELACASFHLKHAVDVLGFLATDRQAGTPESRARVRRDFTWLRGFALTRISEARIRLEPPLVYRYCSAGGCSGASIAEVQRAISSVFGSRAGEAIRVSSCETGQKFHTNAANGQYRGIFQMGDHERATYGDASDALGQARAAHRYFVASGSDWSPWSCRP